jgi:type IV secretion system protein VirB5
MQVKVPSKPNASEISTPTRMKDRLPGGEQMPKPELTRAESYNPYLAGRREWDERYGDLVSRVQKANRFAVICGVIALLETPALIAMALRAPKVMVIAVSADGQYLASGTSGAPVVITDSMKRSTIAAWVTDLRVVTTDPVSQRSAIEKVYAMISSGSSAQSEVSEFYRGEPPQTRAATETVHVNVNSVLPMSDKTYEVEWIEVARDLQGKVVSEQRWKGAFSFVLSATPPNDERLSRLNPLGLYVTEAHWSKVL